MGGLVNLNLILSPLIRFGSSLKLEDIGTIGQTNPKVTMGATKTIGICAEGTKGCTKVDRDGVGVPMVELDQEVVEQAALILTSLMGRVGHLGLGAIDEEIECFPWCW